MKIVLPADSLVMSSGELISGVIYFDFGEKQFPDISWNDNVVVVFGWWLQAINESMASKKDHVSLVFMDGPLSMEASFLHGDKCFLKCVSGKGRDVVHEESVGARYFLEQIYSSAIELCGECDRRGWVGRDVSSLKQGIKNGKIGMYKLGHGDQGRDTRK